MRQTFKKTFSRKFTIEEHIRLVCQLDLPNDFEVKTDTKLTLNCQLREKSKIGIQILLNKVDSNFCIFLRRTSSLKYLSRGKFFKLEYSLGKIYSPDFYQDISGDTFKSDILQIFCMSLLY